jgi:hypothetical protein
MDVQNIEAVNFAQHAELVELVAQFDAGKISRREFHRRARALPNEYLVLLSRILAASPSGGSAPTPHREKPEESHFSGVQ